MASDDSNRLVIRGYPIALWIVSLVAFGIGVWMAIQGLKTPNMLFVSAIPLLIGFLLFAFAATIDTIIVDRTTGLFSTRRQSLLRNVYKEIPLSEISHVRVDSSTSRDSKGHRSTTYQMQVVLRTGDIVPLETGYSSGASGRQAKADKLRAFMGVGGVDETPIGAIRTAFQMAETAVQQRFPGNTGVTNGVSWRLETKALGAYPVTRWGSTDFTLPGGFLLLTQKVGGVSIGLGGGLLGGLGALIQQQALGMYGFQSGDTPGIGNAQPVQGLDPRLAQFYDSLASDPSIARQLINAWITQPLIDWAQQNPASQVQSSDKIGPLLVLCSPNGVYLCHFNAPASGRETMLPELGAALVRALGGGAKSTGW